MAQDRPRRSRRREEPRPRSRRRAKRRPPRSPRRSAPVPLPAGAEAARPPPRPSCPRRSARPRQRLLAPLAPAIAGADAAILDRLWQVVEDRRQAGDAQISHSARLLARGTAKVAQKLGEEAVECVIEADARQPRRDRAGKRRPAVSPGRGLGGCRHPPAGGLGRARAPAGHLRHRREGGPAAGHPARGGHQQAALSACAAGRTAPGCGRRRPAMMP